MAIHQKIYRARFVLPIDRPPIENGFVAIAQGAIEEVGPWNSKKPSSPAPITDLGDVALIPALVNAHTHLEFSHLRDPLGFPGIEFTDWIRLVVGHRKRDQPIAESLPLTNPIGKGQVSSMSINRVQTRPSKGNSIRRGLAESYRSGVGCLGEIATFPCSLKDYHCSSPAGINGVVFYEQLGSQLDQFPIRGEELSHFLNGSSTNPSPLQLGVSPHAPYSVHPQLLEQMLELAIQTGSPIAMHLAETEAERELLTQQTGPFVDLLQDLGVWEPANFKSSPSILEILSSLSRCRRTLIVHGNYLTSEEQRFLGQHRNHMSLIYCPRTHNFFQHAAYPLEQLLRTGVRVAIGTDSRASNPDLNLFAELQQIQKQLGNLCPLKILELGTMEGAIGLGLAAHLGTLSQHKLARLSVIENVTCSASDWAWLLDSQASCRPLEHA